MITLGRWVKEMEPMPKGYGIAWLTVNAFRAYCLPVPLNRIAGALHSLWYWLKLPGTSHPLINAYSKGYADGQRSGREEGYERGLHMARIILEETGQIQGWIPNIRG